MNNTCINGVTNLTASGTVASDIASTNTLKISGAGITTKTDLVLFRGLSNPIYLGAHSSGVLFYSDD